VAYGIQISRPSLNRGVLRYDPLNIGGLQEVDYRSKTFSCSQYGSQAYLAVIDPTKETGMQDYRVDAIERSPSYSVGQLAGRRLSPPLDHSGSELPDRNAGSLLHPAAALPIIGSILTIHASRW
jgi:hypothetical protein